MSITATTLSGAVGVTDAVINVASATGITAPGFATGTGFTFLLIDQEYMFVMAVSGTLITVVRGQLGSNAQAHVINTQVQIGLPADFPLSNLLLNREIANTLIVGALNLPAVFLAGSADAVPSTVPGLYVVKTAGVDAMTLAAPTAAQEGNIIEIYSDTANAHTLTAPSAIFACGALKTVATFPAAKGAGVRLRACNLFWHVLSTSGTGTNSGPVVWT